MYSAQESIVKCSNYSSKFNLHHVVIAVAQGLDVGPEQVHLLFHLLDLDLALVELLVLLQKLSLVDQLLASENLFDRVKRLSRLKQNWYFI